MGLSPLTRVPLRSPVEPRGGQGTALGRRTLEPPPVPSSPMTPLLHSVLARPALAAALQGDGGLIDSAEGLFMGMIVLTAVAGWLDVLHKARGSELWPVPLVIYATMMPVVTFIIVLAQVKGEPVHPGNLAAIVSPLPFILFLRLRGRGASAS